MAVEAPRSPKAYGETATGAKSPQPLTPDFGGDSPWFRDRLADVSILRIFPTLCLLFVAAPVGARPNILFILTDDQAAWALGAEDERAKTPNMDRLGAEGARLTRAFTVTPVCSPSRASLMTSRYGSEVGITEWLNPGKEAKLGLDPALPVWPRLLKDAGYSTGLIGKWHLGLTDEFHPTKFGFDFFMGNRGGGWSPKDPSFEKDGVTRKYEGLSTDILADEVIAFLDRNREKAFALCWHTRAPHTVWLPVAGEDWAPYADMDPAIPNPDYPGLDAPRVKKFTREYLASVRGVDRNLGRVLARLDELKLADNTLVVFTSDHGYSMGHNGIWHKGNGHWLLTKDALPKATKNIPSDQRPNMYDNSVRVPAIVRWPGRVAPGSTIERTVTNLDWFPTLLAAAGVPVPDGTLLRGRNALPVLGGKAPADWDDDVFGQYSTRHESRTHMRMIRSRDWKLIRDFLNEGRDELYRLARDPAERENLITSNDPEVKAARRDLEAKLAARMRAINDPVTAVVE